MRLNSIPGGLLLLSLSIIVSSFWITTPLPFGMMNRLDQAGAALFAAPNNINAATLSLLEDQKNAETENSTTFLAPNTAVKVEVRAEVQTGSDSDARANAFASGPGNAEVLANLEGAGNAVAQSVEPGKAVVSANVDGTANALAQAGTPGETQVEAEAAGPGSAEASARTGDWQDTEQGTHPLTANQQRSDTQQFGSPQAVVNEGLVNVRTGPDTTYPVVGQVRNGESFAIVSRNESGRWWQICCYNQRNVWITDRYIDPIGRLANVPVEKDIAAPPTPTAVATPIPTATPQQVRAALPWRFELEMATRHHEANTAVIYAWIHEDGRALDGYFLRIVKDGRLLSSPARSADLPLGTTKPTEAGSVENKIYNLKADYNLISNPGFNPVGTWTLQLVDGGGKAVGPPASFLLKENDPNMEMYIRYKLVQ